MAAVHRPGPAVRRLVALALGPVAFGLVLAAPLPGLAPAAHRLAAVFVWAVVYWAVAPVPLAVTAVGASLLAVALGVGPLRTVGLAYVDPVILLFVGSFVLAAALQDSGLDRRFASALLRQRWATRTPTRLLAAVGIVACALSLWLSNTTTTALMLPLRDMVRAGLLLDLAGAVTIWLGLRVLCPLMGVM